MNTISPNTKFSYNIIKGSTKSRQKLVSKLNEEFFDSFIKYAETKRIQNFDIREIFSKILPENKSIEIKKINSNKEFIAASDYSYSDKNKDIIGLTLELPFLNSILKAKDIPTLMHECTHVLSTLTNPKHTALAQKLYRDDKYTNSYDNWFDNILYTDEKITKNYTVSDMLNSVRENTLRFLEGKTNQDKIDFLQDARYELQQELDAHKEQLKYANKLKEMGYKINKEDLIDEDKFFFFTEKIELLNEILLNVLNKTRKKNSSKIKRRKLHTKQ